MSRHARHAADPEPAEGAGVPPTTEARVNALEAGAGVLLTPEWRRFIISLIEHLDDVHKHRSED